MLASVELNPMLNECVGDYSALTMAKAVILGDPLLMDFEDPLGGYIVLEQEGLGHELSPTPVWVDSSQRSKVSIEGTLRDDTPVEDQLGDSFDGLLVQTFVGVEHDDPTTICWCLSWVKELNSLVASSSEINECSRFHFNPN